MGTRGGQGGDVSAYGAPPPDAARLHGDGEHEEGFDCGGSEGATGSGPRIGAAVTGATVPLLLSTSQHDVSPRSKRPGYDPS